MLLIVNGEIIDSSVEQDIRTDSEFGFDVVVLFRRHASKEIDNRQTIHSWHNINQVHNRFPSLICVEKRPRIAFESDYIHRSGGWRYIDEIEMVIVSLATIRHEECCVPLHMKNFGTIK